MRPGLVYVGATVREGRLGFQAILYTDHADFGPAMCEGPPADPKKLRADLAYFRAAACEGSLKYLAMSQSDLVNFVAASQLLSFLLRPVSKFSCEGPPN